MTLRTRVEPLQYWFHDLCSCLQDCLGTLLIQKGHDPIVVMGAAWEFFYREEDVLAVEFYFPSPRGELGRDLMPYHPVRAQWRVHDDGARAMKQIEEVVASGEPVIVAEDNFFMPNRPAFGDVHAAHLVVVSGFDHDLDCVYILESTPPLYAGPVSRQDFLRARNSQNDARPGTRDNFFAGSAIRNRWIDVEFGDDFPEPTQRWVSNVLRANVVGFRTTSGSRGALTGVSGLLTYLERVCEKDAEGRAFGRSLSELYTVGWASQAQTALHADFLYAMARRHGWPDLARAARQVEKLASWWTVLRMLGAHGAHGSMSRDRAHRELRARIPRFVEGHHAALRLIEDALGDEVRTGHEGQ